MKWPRPMPGGPFRSQPWTEKKYSSRVLFLIHTLSDKTPGPRCPFGKSSAHPGRALSLVPARTPNSALWCPPGEGPQQSRPPLCRRAVFPSIPLRIDRPSNCGWNGPRNTPKGGHQGRASKTRLSGIDRPNAEAAFDQFFDSFPPPSHPGRHAQS